MGKYVVFFVYRRSYLLPGMVLRNSYQTPAPQLRTSTQHHAAEILRLFVGDSKFSSFFLFDWFASPKTRGCFATPAKKKMITTTF